MRGRRRLGAHATVPMLQDTPLVASSWSTLWAARRSSNSSASCSGATPRKRDSSEANNDRTTSHTCICMRSKHCSQVVDHGTHLFRCCFLWSYRDSQNILLQLITSALQQAITIPRYSCTCIHSFPSRSFALVFWTSGFASWWQMWTRCTKIFETEILCGGKIFKQTLQVRRCN
jgi:hypothetical protein